MPSKRLLSIIPLIFWIIIITIKVIRLVPFYEGDDLIFRLGSIVITAPLDIFSFCFFYYLIIPKILIKKQRIMYSFLGLLFITLFSFVFVWIYHVTGRIETYEASVMIYKSSVGHTLLSLMYAIVLRLSVDWFNRYRHEKELEEINKTTELALLRSQINPHFLFNTLNNINSFSTRDPEKTSYAIIKLSDIMRYMLYDAANEKVRLEQEVEYINNYIALQKLRYKENDFVKFIVEGDISKVMIPPMIFLPFVENAFKHGTNTIVNGITIQLIINTDILEFVCNNRIKELSDTEKDGPGGVGIKNIERRLELLYPEKHKLTLSKDKNEYIVNLIINLNEH